MGRVRLAGRWAAAAIVVAAVAVLVPARASRAVEAFDGRFQLHGFYENQTRVIARNFSGADDWDLTQWYQVLNLEMELDIAPDGFGPFDLISAYARVEARYDCVWTRACRIFPNVDTYGDRTRHLPKRLSDSRRAGFTGSQFTGDVRKRHGIPFNRLGIEFGVPLDSLGNPFDAPRIFNDRETLKIWNVPGIDTLFGVNGPDGIEGSTDDPAAFVLSEFLDFEFASRKVRGNQGGVGTQTLGPWLPKNFVDPTGALANKPNPFSTLDTNTTVLGPGPDGIIGTPDDPTGGNARAFRPAPLIAAGNNPVDQQFPRGIYYPNQGVANLIADDNLDNPDQNFTENELQWNRGASQQQTHFLKEAYLDIELLDSSLWLRLGKQSIVWGKTELFRTTDQFNPQDLALATLPSLEESRVALWAARAVWSLWSVGPLEDVRLEVAANIDTFQGADLGQCGEPFTANPVCDIRAGLFAHGITGFGLVGVTKPEDPWEDIKGLEVGFRAEFRWDRFSFAITDFYGYDDFPFVDQVFRYERNVDPYTGRLRRGETRDPCDPLSERPASAGGVGVTTGCLGPGSDALVNHHANQQLFAFICSTSIGFTDLDASVCAQSVFNSGLNLLGGATVTPARAISAVLTGDLTGVGLGSALLGFLTGAATLPQNIPLVDLGLVDRTGDGISDDPANDGEGFLGLLDVGHLDGHLSAQQRALLGCGPILGQDASDPGLAANEIARPCHNLGIDLLNAEASALTSAWLTQPGVQGTSYLNLVGPAPGTVGWYAQRDRFHCQRFVEDVGLVVLPGCRAAGVPGLLAREASFDFGVDGDSALVGPNEAAVGVASIFSCAPGAEGSAPTAMATGFCGTGNPFVGDPLGDGSGQWASTMDAFSWNLQMLLVVFTAIGATGQDEIAGTPDDFLNINTFDPANPMATDKCSWVAPQFCSNVSALLSVMGRRRNTVKAGGSAFAGRQDFVWHGGSSNRLKYDKRNVLGFSMDFAEDRTKTNWSVEMTWIHDLNVSDNDALDGITEIDQYNLTVSVDRPTFVNFLNQGRTIFINSQWFFRFEDGFEQSHPRNGPFNVLFTLTAFTGFYQDRLNPSFTHVYDFMSESGAVLPSINYRFSESFSVEFGLAFFYGKWQSTRMPINPVSLGNQAGSGAYRSFSERGLAVVRDRDEAFLRIRKTF